LINNKLELPHPIKKQTVLRKAFNKNKKNSARIPSTDTVSKHKHVCTKKKG
jgi:hypothetical protein